MKRRPTRNVSNLIIFILEVIVLIPLCILFFDTLRLLESNSVEAIATMVTIPIVMVLLAIETILNIIGLGVSFKSRTWYWILIEIVALVIDASMIIKLVVLIN